MDGGTCGESSCGFYDGQEAAGASDTRVCLLPLSFEGQKFGQTSDASRRENAASYPLGCLKNETKKLAAEQNASGYLAAGVGTRIAAAGGFGQPAEVVGPALLMAGADRSVGQAAMGHAQQRSTRLMIDQVDLGQARPRRAIFAARPPRASGRGG